MTTTFDTIVIGAGAMGTAAAYYLSRRRQRVLLLEQFELDHQKGSSYGYSRIIRYTYHFPEYVDLAKDTYPLWFALEDELGERLIFKTGGIDFGPPDDEMMQSTIAATRDSGLDHDLLNADEAGYRFPQFRFRDDFDVLYQPDSGYVAASRAVLGHVKLARKYGATVYENTEVKDISIQPDSVTVSTAQGDFSAGAVVLTAGSWAKSLLGQTGIELPLTPLRCQLNFVATEHGDQYAAENCPVWIAHVSKMYFRKRFTASHHTVARASKRPSMAGRPTRIQRRLTEPRIQPTLRRFSNSCARISRAWPTPP